MSEDEKFMRAALALAPRGRGFVEPNPMVGATIVRDGRIIAEGWHTRFGGPHAEREALAAAEQSGIDPRGATMYVTLEPCCHFGKTPPCTELINRAGIVRVVFTMTDPDSLVAGKGAEALRQAGVEVVAGVCEAEARELLAAYIKHRTRRRPWVICKWAQTSDGYLAMPAGRGRWVSSEQSRHDAHRIRGQCDGVLVGVGTVLADDPLLTAREGGPRQPARLVLDGELRTPPGSQLVRTARQSPVIVVAAGGALERHAAAADALFKAGVELFEVPAGAGGLDLGALLDELGRRRWTNLLVEGGRAVLDSFITQGLADELVVYTAPQPLGAAGAGLARLNFDDVAKAIRLREVERQQFGADTMVRSRVER